MPNGVSREFIDLLARQRQQARRRLLAVPVLAALGYVVAELADVAPVGLYVQIYAVLLLAGAFVLFWVAGRVYGSFEASIRQDWDAWMAAAPRSETVLEAAERVMGEEGLLSAAPTLGVALALANLAALAMLWFDALAAGAFSLVVVALDAVAVAAYTAWHGRSLRWAQRFDQAVQEMWRDGEVGVYGSA